MSPQNDKEWLLEATSENREFPKRPDAFTMGK